MSNRNPVTSWKEQRPAKKTGDKTCKRDIRRCRVFDIYVALARAVLRIRERAGIWFGYFRRSRCERGLLLAYVQRVSGYSRAHVIRLIVAKTRSSPVQIAVRKARATNGLPGYIRIDTVHQGDQDGVKGVYHVNAVDIVTQ